MRAVFGSEERVEVPGLKAQDRRKVNREVKVVDGLMLNLVKDRRPEINRLLYTGSYVVTESLGLMGKKKGNKFKKKKPR